MYWKVPQILVVQYVLYLVCDGKPPVLFSYSLLVEEKLLFLFGTNKFIYGVFWLLFENQKSTSENVLF